MSEVPARRDVVLLHGTAMSSRRTWRTLVPLLEEAGHTVHLVDHGQHGRGLVSQRRAPAHLGGYGSIETSASEVATYVAQLGRPVDLVAHSVGALVGQYYLKRVGGAKHVGRFVGVCPTWHGTTFRGLMHAPAVRWAAQVLWAGNIGQQYARSAFVRDLYRDGETAPGVEYVALSTDRDRVTTPWQRQRLDAPNATNLLLQDRDPANRCGHVSILDDPTAMTWVVESLD